MRSLSRIQLVCEAGWDATLRRTKALRFFYAQ